MGDVGQSSGDGDDGQASKGVCDAAVADGGRAALFAETCIL